MTDVEELANAYADRRAPHLDRGTVTLIVIRRGGGVHECPESAELSEREGLVGDRWSEKDDPDRLGQITLMMRGVAETVANGKPLDMPGDNFLVDIDLAESNAPAGTKLRLGSALLEISAEPHTGCKKFSERFGSAALRWVNHRDNRPRRLRGVNCKVIEGGTVALGNTVEIVR